ncbi:MAG: DUF4105 domain-containing protein [Elusimicrobia bacterium]|nr:DUF4105 domain-containing protein [Elusimicrobiota bacterium]
MAAAAAAAEPPGGRARQGLLSRSRAWRALLHYRGATSQADGAAFFLAPDGKRDLEAELQADLRAFAGPPVADDSDAKGEDRPQHAQCRFPARWAFLKERLRIAPSEIAEQPCPRFEEWRKSIDAAGLSVVFADAYLNNPSSMYGHTFLRLHRAGATSGEDLLDYTVNFAATPDTENGFLYAVKGLIGSFPGRFSTMPYYMKIQEYNNVESRDLWEYRLSWGREKVDRLVRHLWEMGSTHFDYYFFDENCSFQLLTLLEGVDPELELSSRFGFGVIPTDTLRAVLDQPGLPVSAKFRPSHLTQLKFRRERLSAAETALAGKLGRGADPESLPALEKLPPARRALTLDSAHDLFRYRVGFDTELADAAKREERKLLVARGKLGLASPDEQGAPHPAPPEAGHRTRRIGAGGGTNSLGPFADVYWRAALHDLLDDPAGYVPDHQLEMANAVLRLDGRRKEAYFETFDVVRLVSLSPWDPWIKKTSWFAATGLEQAREYRCAGWGCADYYARGGGGLSAVTRLFRRETWYAFLTGDFGAGPVLESGWRGGGGVAGGLKVEFGPSWRALVEAGELRYGWGPPRSWMKASQQVRLGKGFELRVSAERRVPVNEVSAALLGYF